MSATQRSATTGSIGCAPCSRRWASRRRRRCSRARGACRRSPPPWRQGRRPARIGSARWRRNASRWTAASSFGAGRVGHAIHHRWTRGAPGPVLAAPRRGGLGRHRYGPDVNIAGVGWGTRWESNAGCVRFPEWEGSLAIAFLGRPRSGTARYRAYLPLGARGGGRPRDRHLRGRLLLVHGGALCRSPRGVFRDVRLHGWAQTEPHLRRSLVGGDRPRGVRPGDLRPREGELRAPPGGVLAQYRSLGQRRPVLRSRDPVPLRDFLSRRGPTLPRRSVQAEARGGAALQGQDRHPRSEEHTSELQSLAYLVCRLLLEKKKNDDHATRCQSRTER